MTAGVNLLPPEIAQRARARRTAGITAGGVGLYVLLLLGIYLLKLGAVADARNDRDEAQAEVVSLQAEVDSLAEFAELDRQLTARNELLAASMATEISWARVLNDLALAYPGSSSLLTINAAQVNATATATAEGEPRIGSGIGTVEFTGYSVERFAPGVETALIKFNEVRAFDNPYLAQANEALRDATEVTTYEGAVRLNEEALTRRYADGLPAEVDE